MWVLINENGQVVTQIPHGQIIRQGSTFHIYVAFEKNYFKKYLGRDIAIYSIERLKEWVNNHIEATFSFDGTFDTYPSDSERIFFEKLLDNENLCSFKDKEWYLVFKYNGTPSQSEDYGTFNLNLRLSKIERNTAGEIQTHQVDVIGPISVYIEKTYGKKTNNNTVTREQIDELLDLINLKGKNNVIHYISEYMFESYHELAQYCLEELDFKEESKIVYADVLNNMTIATVNNLTKRVMMISSDGSILCSNGYKYYYVSQSDIQILNSLMIGDDIQLLINNGNLVFKSSKGEAQLNLEKESQGVLIGKPYLETFATLKQKEAMPYIGVDPPSVNNQLNQLWFQVVENEIEDEVVTTFGLKRPQVELPTIQQPQEEPIVVDQREVLINEPVEQCYVNKPVETGEQLIAEEGDILISEPQDVLIVEGQETLICDSSDDILLN